MPDVPLKTPDGKSVEYVPAEKVQFFKDQGYTTTSTGEQGDLTTKPAPRGTGIEGAVVGGLSSLASGVSLGTSDLAARALLSPDSVDYIRQSRENHPIISTLGNVAGAVIGGAASGGASLEGEGAGLLASSPAAAVSRLGSGIAERAGGGVAGAVKAGVAEGSLYGAGNAVSELALSDDPLTAEHIASTLSSNVLLGAGLGGVAGGAFKLGERALSRASSALTDAGAAKAALAGVPEDLAGLDAAGLREASATERAALKTQAEAETARLEAERVPQRQQLADEIKELHQTLANEAPISKAVQGADVGAIEGVKNIRVQLAKSYGGIRTAFDSPLSVARDPSSLIRPLEMRQSALEALQAKVPEIQEVLGADARGAALRHVDDALVETKQQLAQIRGLSKANPVSSPALTDLTSGVSPRLKAIEAAQEALGNAPKKGAVQKAVEGAAFGGGTALAHMIPGVGIAAPFMGKGASDLVGRLFDHLSGAGAAVAKKSGEVAKTFLDVTSKIAPVAPATATQTLRAVRFAMTDHEHTGDEKLPELYNARSAELRSQTTFAPDGSVQMRPDARAEMSKRLDPIASVNPLLADKIETIAARKVAFLSSKLPRQPDIGGIQIGPDMWHPSDMEMRTWARYVTAAEDPAGVEDRLVHGIVTPEDAEAYRTIYPERFAALHGKLMAAAPTLAKTLPYARRLAWSVFAGVPIDASMSPNVLAVLQGTFTRPPPSSDAGVPGMQPQKAQPQFGSLGSLKSSDKPTPAQQRASGAQP